MASVTERRVELLEEGLDQLLEEHNRGRSLEEFERYADDPVAFMEDVLRWKPWSAQRDLALKVRDNRFVVVRSANSIGKDALAARLALWWVYARCGYALITGPTERQVKEILFKEIRRAFVPDLPGRLWSSSLEVDGENRILGFTSNNPDAMTGFHDPRVLVCITEGQGVEEFTYQGAISCASSVDSRIYVAGNPLRPSGRFYEICRAKHWASVRIRADEHPNVVEGREVIPGAVTREWVESIRQEYGEDSDVFRARVLAEFPTDAADALVKREWLDAATMKFEHDGLDLHRLYRAPVRMALDVAHSGGDFTVLAVLQGHILRPFRRVDNEEALREAARDGFSPVWVAQETMTTARWARIASLEIGISAWPPYHLVAAPPPVTVDAAGMGLGVYERMAELNRESSVTVPVSGFNSSHAASQPGKFLNRRAAAYWALRKQLEEGSLGLPNDQYLLEELISTEWSLTSAGKIQIAAKDELRSRLGRSPDRADAVSMLFGGSRPIDTTPIMWFS